MHYSYKFEYECVVAFGLYCVQINLRTHEAQDVEQVV